MITCQACGTQNPDTAQYCSKCARKLDTETQAAVARQREEHTATGVRWSAVAAALIAVLVVVLVVALFAAHVI